MHFCIFKVWLCAHMWQVISFCIGIAVMIPSIQETEILSDYVKCICFKSRNISLSNITGGSYIEESVIIDDQVKLFILIYAGIFLDEELSYSPLFKPAYLSWLLYSWHFGCCTLQLFSDICQCHTQQSWQNFELNPLFCQGILFSFHVLYFGDISYQLILNNIINLYVTCLFLPPD